MNNFADFARYYDLFYKDKNYAGEAAFVQKLLEEHAPGARKLIELGCGTAKHAVHWLQGGCTVTGVDRSAQMLQEAARTVSSLPAPVRSRLSLVEADVTRLPAVATHDAAVSLFHVVNYQTENDRLAGMFAGARRSLEPGGVFLFDFWYGPAVLSDRPMVRVRELRSDTGETVIRIAEPELDVNRNVVTVHYRLLVSKAGEALREYRESHHMRYLFMPEIAMIARQAGFQVEACGQWLTKTPLSDESWLGWVVARAV
jgi:ubiquinone/menaquinone biosynthesis C-methylase UbiE